MYYVSLFIILRTIDSLAVGYGKGKLTCFVGNPKQIVDVVSYSNPLLI